MNDVVSKDKIGMGRTLAGHDISGLLNRVVLDRDRISATTNHKHCGIIRNDVNQQIVCDADAFCLLAGLITISPQDTETGV